MSLPAVGPPTVSRGAGRIVPATPLPALSVMPLHVHRCIGYDATGAGSAAAAPTRGPVTATDYCGSEISATVAP